MNGSGTTQHSYKADSTDQQQRAEQREGAATSNSAANDHEEQNTGTHEALDEKAIGLVDDLQLWWSMRTDLWAELQGLFAAERSLAVNSLVKLIIGGILALMLILMCMLLTETLLALALFAIGIPMPGSIAVLLGLNVLGLILLIKGLKPLPGKLSFKVTRAALLNDQNTEDA